MSINFDRDRDVLTIGCDFCNRRHEEYEGDDFGEAFAYAKLDGWRAFKDAHGDWAHKCPDCMGEPE